MAENYIDDILSDVGNIIERKNHDYNYAFDKACDRLGNTYAAGKIYEKTERIITLLSEPPQVQGEPLEDALKDCIGYCTLLLNRLYLNK